jgi:transposase
VKKQRRHWRQNQPRLDSRRLVFIDETGLSTKLARLYGRSTRGERCVSAVPHGHWRSTSFIAALRVDRLSAPFVIEGAVNAGVFTAYLENVLGPELAENDLVILDNLATHKIGAVKTLIEARGASVRYLPPYSPDLNPIEQAFAKLKAHLREKAARTLPDLEQALAASLKLFRPEHCQNFFAHAQYVSI